MNEICCLQKTPPKSSILEPNVDRGEDAILHIKERGQQSLPLQYHLPLQALLTSSSWNSLVASDWGTQFSSLAFKLPLGLWCPGACSRARPRKGGEKWFMLGCRQHPERTGWLQRLSGCENQPANIPITFLMDKKMKTQKSGITSYHF